MDISNLKASHVQLMDFLTDNGYCKDVKSNVRRCIKMVLDIGGSPDICCYEDIFNRVVGDHNLSVGSPRYNRLKHGIGTVWAFDTQGKYPDMKSTGFMATPTIVDGLNSCFRDLAESHLTNGAINGKRKKTVYTEYRAAVNLYAHFQREGAASLEDATPAMVYSFFHDGDRQTRGGDYRSLVCAALKSVSGNQQPSAKRILSWMPIIKRKRKIFEFLTPEEGASIRGALEDEGNCLSSFDRAVGWLLYFCGLRGTDIANLQLGSIDWENDRICLVQSKTGYPLTLPMNAAVGNSLFDYVTTRDPKVNGSGPVFVPKRPSGSVSERVTSAVARVFKTSGVRVDGGTKGVRVFRHHFVTHLLSNGVLCEVVTRLAGHHSPESIKFYADADYEHLRECAIDISAYPVDDRIFTLP